MIKRRGVTVAVVILWLAYAPTACQTRPPADDYAIEPPDDYRTLIGKFAEEPVTTSLVADEAYIGPDDFYIRTKAMPGSFSPAVAGLIGLTYWRLSNKPTVVMAGHTFCQSSINKPFVGPACLASSSHQES